MICECSADNCKPILKLNTDTMTLVLTCDCCGFPIETDPETLVKLLKSLEPDCLLADWRHQDSGQLLIRYRIPGDNLIVICKYSFVCSPLLEHTTFSKN